MNCYICEHTPVLGGQDITSRPPSGSASTAALPCATGTPTNQMSPVLRCFTQDVPSSRIRRMHHLKRKEGLSRLAA